MNKQLETFSMYTPQKYGMKKGYIWGITSAHSLFGVSQKESLVTDGSRCWRASQPSSACSCLPHTGNWQAKAPHMQMLGLRLQVWRPLGHQRPKGCGRVTQPRQRHLLHATECTKSVLSIGIYAKANLVWFTVLSVPMSSLILDDQCSCPRGLQMNGS